MSAAKKLVNAVVGIGGSAVGIAIYQNLSGGAATATASGSASEKPSSVAIASTSSPTGGKQVQ